MAIRGLERSVESHHQELLHLGLDPQNMPVHIACVMDGNGRWAKKQGKPRVAGHRAGVDALRSVVRASIELGIHYLSVFAFSTENWTRPEKEVSFLMNLFNSLLDSEVKTLHQEGVRIRFGGRIEALSNLSDQINQAEVLTKDNQVIQFNIMLNYGGRQEIVDAVNQWLAERKEGDVLTEDVIQRNLYIPESPETDLWIRSSGECRLSNYLLWQSAYAELVFEQTLWPDFTKETLVSCIQSYQNRQRRFGGL